LKGVYLKGIVFYFMGRIEGLCVEDLRVLTLSLEKIGDLGKSARGKVNIFFEFKKTFPTFAVLL